MAAAMSGCAVAAGSGAPAEPRAVISKAKGDLHVANSRDGQAIFEAQGLAPGRSVTGTVELSNDGALAGSLGLVQLEVQDRPGVNGGRLSDAVYLDVEDVTGGSAVPVFAGPLGALTSRSLGGISPGEARTYQFTASLPDGGPPPSPTGGDNAYAGSALTVHYSWKATAPEPGDGPGDGPASGRRPIVTKVPKVTLYVISKRLLTRGLLDVMASCNRACHMRAWAQLPGAKHARKGVKTRPRSALLTIPDRVGRIRLKLSGRSRRTLLRALRTKKRVAVTVSLRVVAIGWSPTKVYTKRVVVRRPKPSRSPARARAR
jgi:hypothetical protein